MSKEFFTAIIVGVVVMFMIIGSLWFSPNSVLRLRLPSRQVVKIDQTNSMPENSEEQVLVNMSATEYRFSQSVINAKAGQRISVTLQNAGEMVHDFVVETGDGKYSTKKLEPGMSETIEFVVEKPGEYDFYCSIVGHREQGMEGKLVVR